MKHVVISVALVLAAAPSPAWSACPVGSKATAVAKAVPVRFGVWIVIDDGRAGKLVALVDHNRVAQSPDRLAVACLAGDVVTRLFLPLTKA